MVNNWYEKKPNLFITSICHWRTVFFVFFVVVFVLTFFNLGLLQVCSISCYPHSPFPFSLNVLNSETLLYFTFVLGILFSGSTKIIMDSFCGIGARESLKKPKKSNLILQIGRRIPTLPFPPPLLFSWVKLYFNSRLT